MNPEQHNGPGLMARVNEIAGDPRKRRRLIGILGVIEIAMVVGIIILVINFIAPSANPLAFLARKTPIPTPVATPACVRPMLAIGTASFPIQPVKRGADGAVRLPAGALDTAYWVDGTTKSFVFGLNQSPAALALHTALKAGDLIKITWADCSSDDYVVKTVDAGQPDASVYDQALPGVRVFIVDAAGQQGFIIRGARPQAQTVETPAPTQAGAVNAQVDFGNTVVSPDGKTLSLTITITNQGSDPISLAAKDISLTAENQAPQAPFSVDPALPVQIAAGAKASMTLVFSKPAAQTAVFKVLDFSVDLYY